MITPTHPGFAGAPRPGWFDSVDDLARAYARSFPHARFELIPQAGHMAQLEQPERLLKLVGEFM